MQINGDDFLKKVQLKQEGEELQRKLNELNQAESNMQNLNLSNNLNSAYNSNSNSSYEEIQRLQNNIKIDSEDEFDSLILEKRSNRSSNKKKYILLGAVLLVLFFLTIMLFGLLSNNNKKADPFTDSTNEVIEKNDSSNIEEDYKRILDETNRKSATETLEKSNTTNSLDDIIQVEENVNVMEQEPEITISDELINNTIKKVEEKKAPVPAPKVIETKPTKVEAKTSIKDLVEGKNNQGTQATTPKATNSTAKAYYVQIGAFSKQPNSAYLQKIKQNGFEYKVLNEKNLNKVLIGPFKDRAEANTKVPSIKEKLNINGNPFIVYN
ncbi:SPOR domain-containing protein [Aliarcobacter thereius]|uniref:SPOR domain-containing protein n=2 Tax=Aliarcobacter thereius TaxID=544718 RepID=A0A5R9GXR5_9BACT|nr:SPOR domain-containing protein [Aliarcobacter thereius]OCL89775.1 rare lipoprotein A [Aliarcobacter thereius]OCL96425.1 rare lipoprotein A [Aliarcobacter thereius LMG 24486]QBF15613.1 SPOR domain-containing protein [Aliarcobacter thereius LMG 24486]TLS71526.1 SPOR domain-containing protein [Aliarcobacter thereius]TLS91709.1 SPOR domain-containing protein [Aliarcobacter thereius]